MHQTVILSENLSADCFEQSNFQIGIPIDKVKIHSNSSCCKAKRIIGFQCLSVDANKLLFFSVSDLNYRVENLSWEYSTSIQVKNQAHLTLKMNDARQK